MSSTVPRRLMEMHYLKTAQAYLASLPLEHFMEAPPQATQREITVESFAVLRLRRPDVQYFNELLVQYPYGPASETRQVVPDNMIVLHDGPITIAAGSYDVPLQPVGPFMVLEYVSKSSVRKDYDGSYLKYERELKVPYYLIFYPETQDLTLFRRGSRRYASVRPIESGRLAIPEIDLEVGLLDGWARYWHRGELLPLPADFQRSLDQAREEARQAQETARQANEKARQADEKLEKLRAQLRALGVDPSV